ncbi:hypothetical protein BV20DRAFT_949574, partial [Pilatotrama ljubarskyi]
PPYGQNQPVLIQYRTHIWLPGVVSGHYYSALFQRVLTTVEFVRADGERTCSVFFDEDVRSAA